MMALSLCLAKPISRRKIKLMIGVLQMSENMFMKTAKTGESNPFCMIWIKLTPIMNRGSRKTALRVKVMMRKDMVISKTMFMKIREK